jgi:hypothetical protein
MHAAYNPAQWSTFFSAEAGASAALTGLLFVALSINLPTIIANPLLTSRSAKALATLVGVLLAATLGLVPGQPAAILGYELLPIAITIWIAITITQRASLHNNPYVGRARKIVHGILAQLSVLPAIVCSVSLIINRGGGLYWLVAAVTFSFIAALFDTWVLLIEIQR